MSRPELSGHASLYYNEKEARKYHSSSRMVGVQREITERALELLRLPNLSLQEGGTPALVLDLGCGSGLSGQVLEEYGHIWIGCDVSRDMLTVAKERLDRRPTDEEEDDEVMNDPILEKRKSYAKDRSKEDDDDEDDDEEEDHQIGEGDQEDDDNDKVMKPSTGDLLHHDMGTGLPFRPATFDACISISALQWLCYSNTSKQVPRQRLTRFLASLYTVLKRGGRAVLQFYPETAEQAVLISECATRVGFAGGVVVDYPNSTKAKKHYLVLSFDRQPAAAQAALVGRTEAPAPHVRVSAPVRERTSAAPVRKKKGGVKTKAWILHKKESQRRQGKTVRPDSKYTARRRPTKF